MFVLVHHRFMVIIWLNCYKISNGDADGIWMVAINSLERLLMYFHKKWGETWTYDVGIRFVFPQGSIHEVFMSA